jgi:hypothetical protein
MPHHLGHGKEENLLRSDSVHSARKLAIMLHAANCAKPAFTAQVMTRQKRWSRV